ncbi:inorganic pyrophosphatase [Bacteriovorax sp. Seq25_V]|uniref:inorganic pyrophosphatase n=1 Tax=Bacteriovorax sp. Seq25_V TaxID=1201288 RepID=UPI00038A0B7C|nr:inorganic pyrophosphatase [Bacteriovorax sp. Seq25_V]EQC44018.1 inorganic diphosphatase [Bacteriovorax sp. Seq25_V]
MNNDQITEFLKVAGHLFRPNPWHGVNVWDDKDKSVLNAYIEITPSDRVKYEIDKATGYLKIDRPQKFSNIIPALYGLIPRTYSAEKSAEYTMKQTGRDGLFGDADPIDVCVLTDKNIDHADILVNCIPIGGFRMLDGGEVDDKIVAVLKDDATYGHMTDITDCPEAILNQLKHYFLTYKEIPQTDKKAKVEITGLYGREEALKIIELGIEDYNDKYTAEYFSKL